VTAASFVVSAAGRLDAVVAGALGLVRADVQRAIADGRVRVDGQVRPKSFRLVGGERVEVDDAGGRSLQAEPGPLTVLFRDDHLLIVSKPAGMVTHPTASRRSGTLVNRLLGLGVPLSTVGGPDRPGIVHRLDAGTSGLLLVAASDAAHVALTEMFRRHAVDRRYLALVRGIPAHRTFLVDAPLERRGARIVVRATSGKEASTLVQVRDELEGAALVEVRPKTGRTHQIRAHLAATGHPVLGDRAYGGGGGDAKRLGLTRPFLHSWRVAFDHPITGERIEREDPLPDDLTEALHRASAR
jgi:23S rRNA pseudouridine1911/1915/1917 synthase